MMNRRKKPLRYFPKRGLYDPHMEHDACGVGFIADIHNAASHDIVQKGLQIMENLTHRGAVGADGNTGDGGGILLQLSDGFFREQKLGFTLPPYGKYAVGMLFLPHDTKIQKFCIEVIKKKAKEEGMHVAGWRDVPFNPAHVGTVARQAMPVIRQVFITGVYPDSETFERMLYILRETIHNTIAAETKMDTEDFYIVSLSSKLITYKGMFLAEQVAQFYPDLNDAAMKSKLAIVHQRFSTNTLPNWKLAQPFRFLAHNGEINTLRGNRNNMRAKELNIESPMFGEKLKRLFPIIKPDGSDSACLDNALELLLRSGRSIAHAMMMLIPEAWGNNEFLDVERRGFYEYHASLMEPWDGPAAVAFTDGDIVGATLDRNGLRPARYVVTNDGLIIMASEVGVLDIPQSNIKENGRLRPGRMLIVDTRENRIISDDDIKNRIISQQPYRQWVVENKIILDDLPKATSAVQPTNTQLHYLHKIFGYTFEDFKFLIKPMAVAGKEPTGSMGNDAALAVLSDQPQLLYNYFRQHFAQVTNPAIDPIREKLVMSLVSWVGYKRNLLSETPLHCNRMRFEQPILSNAELESIRRNKLPNFRTVTLPILFEANGGPGELQTALDRLLERVNHAVDEGYGLIILSDRGVNSQWAPIPALLATGAVHHELIRNGKRGRIGIIIESGEPREVMHFALLFGYGASLVNPYLVMESLTDMAHNNEFEIEMTPDEALNRYIEALNKGLLKVFSKMGISTLQSYRAAQIFEAIGLSQEVIDSYFSGTVSRLNGLGVDVIAQETLMRHAYACADENVYTRGLPVGGQYQYRRDGERHLWNPETITLLQQATRENNTELYKQFAERINNQNKKWCTLRGLFSFKQRNPIPVEEVEPVEKIFPRFCTGAMSFGSISKEAHEMMAIAMNRIGGRSNTGEGGETPERFKPLPNGDSKNSKIKQIASGRFGVTAEYLANAEEIQIKVAQGAKPGEGGQLPGHKVNEIIARIRHSTPGVTLISPPPHHDIYSIEDLKQLIFDLKNINPKAKVSVKLVSEAGVGTVAAGVSKANSDLVIISGYDGGTGAAPLSSMKYAGVPWELGLAETQQVLVQNDLRSRIRVQVDGQMRTGRDVVVAALLGAEEYGFATSVLIVEGCIMMRKCHMNTCPVGVATQNKELRKRFNGHVEHIINYFHLVANEIRELMAQLGFRTIDEMIGRTDIIEVSHTESHWKARSLDFSDVLFRDVPEGVETHCTIEQEDVRAGVIDHGFIKQALPVIEKKKESIIIEDRIRNSNRATGAMLSYEIVKRYGYDGLPDDSIQIKLQGTAGQSFGAFLAKGITLHLTGDANDYVGKGLSGGKIIIHPEQNAGFIPAENIIIGNTVLYGATGGEAYFYGTAGERFAIRNSGVKTVVEGVGDHGCEYMTGGVVVVLGEVGRNFAAGMSGGIAFVYNENGLFDRLCNMSMVDLEPVDRQEDIDILYTLIENHYRYTASCRADGILQNFDNAVRTFVKVMPKEYKRALEERRQREIELRRIAEQKEQQRQMLENNENVNLE